MLSPPLLSPPPFLAEIRKFSKWHAKSPPLVYPKFFLVQNREFPRFIKIPLLKTIFVRKKIWHAKSPPFLAEIGQTQKVHAKSPPPPFFVEKKVKGGGRLCMKSAVYILLHVKNLPYNYKEIWRPKSWTPPTPLKKKSSRNIRESYGPLTVRLRTYSQGIHNF